MPSFIYEYRCDKCGEEVVSRERTDYLADFCGVCYFGRFKRVWSFTYHRGMQEHYNPTVGQPISSMRQFKSALARQGEEYSKLTGTDVNFQPVDYNDTKALGVTGEGLDSTNEARLKKGWKTVSPDG